MLMMLLHQGICFYYSLLCFNPFLCIIVYFANQFGEFLQSVVRGELRAHFLKLLVLTKYVTPINFPSIINQLSTDMLSIFHKYYEYLTVCRTFLLRGKDLTQHSQMVCLESLVFIRLCTRILLFHDSLLMLQQVLLHRTVSL